MADTAKSAVEVAFSYFYGQESEQFTFLRIPKVIFTQEPFTNLSWEARIIYSLMLERMGLSQKNGWFDDENRVFIIFTLEEVQKVLNCGRDKGMKVLAELDTDKGIGLIERVKQGFSEPNHIYVKNFVVRESAEIKGENNDADNPEIRGRENRPMEVEPRSEKSTYRGRNSQPTEVGISESNNINKTNNEIEYSNHILSAETVDNFLHLSERLKKPMDKTEGYILYEQIIKENIDYDILRERNPYQRDIIDEIVDLITDTVSIERKTVRINTTDYPYNVVKSVFLKLNYEHIEYVLESLQNTPTKIGNIRNYLLTMIYNAPNTIHNKIAAEVNHDMYGGGWQEKGII